MPLHTRMCTPFSRLVLPLFGLRTHGLGEGLEDACHHACERLWNSSKGSLEDRPRGGRVFGQTHEAYGWQERHAVLQESIRLFLSRSEEDRLEAAAGGEGGGSEGRRTRVFSRGCQRLLSALATIYFVGRKLTKKRP